MADDRYDWLDKDAAERMLRGEPVSARDDDGARELRQLLDAAAAAGGPAPATTELPGEAAALAAFRQSRTGAGDRARPRTAEVPAATVRAGRPGGVAERTRLGRPFRHGFAVALAVCAIGGVAVAAGTGVLPTPFRHGSADPEPAATISAVESPGTLETQEPDTQTGTESGIPTSPGATPGEDPTGRDTTPAPDGHGSTKAPGTPDGTPGHESPSGAPDDGSGEHQGDRKKFVLALCRDYESGKRGEMDRATRRRLERAAGGPEKVHAFCRDFLARYGDGGGSGGTGSGGTGDGGTSGGSGGGTRPGTGQGDDDDDDSHPSSAPSTTPAPGTSTPAPTPTGPEPGDATPSVTASGQV